MMLLDHSAADVLCTYLISTGVVTAVSTGRPWPAFFGAMGKDPVNAVAVYDTAGIGDGRLMPTGRTVIHPGYSIRIRANTIRIGMKKGLDIENELDKILRKVVTVQNKEYLLHATRRTSPVAPIGEEEGGGRFLFTLNGTLTYGLKPGE